MRVNVDTRALTDHRVRMIAKRLGTDRPGALGRLVLVWHACVESGAYVLRSEEIDAAAETDGMAAAMVASNLGREEASGVYVCGTQGRIEWAKNLEEQRRAAGKVRAAGATRKGGRFTSHQRTSKSPAADGTSTPANASALTPTPALSPALAPSPALEEKNCAAGAAGLESTGRPLPAPRSAQDEPEPPGYQKVLKAYWEAFQGHHGAKPTWGAREGKQLKNLLAKSSPDEIVRRLAIFYGPGCPRWIAEGGRDWASFHNHFNAVASPTTSANGASRPSSGYSTRDLLDLSAKLAGEGK